MTKGTQNEEFKTSENSVPSGLLRADFVAILFDSHKKHKKAMRHDERHCIETVQAA